MGALEHRDGALVLGRRGCEPVLQEQAAAEVAVHVGEGVVVGAEGRGQDLERALARAGLPDPAELAELRLSLARALWDSHQDLARARSLAEQARLALAGAGAAYVPPELAGELERWLAEHPAP